MFSINQGSLMSDIIIIDRLNKMNWFCDCIHFIFYSEFDFINIEISSATDSVQHLGVQSPLISVGDLCPYCITV